MKRLAAAIALALAVSCGPQPPPPPLRPDPPVVTPWVARLDTVCVDILRGIHYRYVVPANGAWGFQYLVNGHWSPTQQAYYRRKGETASVVSSLPVRLVWYREKPGGGYLPARVASPALQGTSTVPCP